MNQEILATQFAFNHFVLQKNLEGLSHEESLFQPDPGGNCINWVVGHIIANRNSIHRLLGTDAIIGEEESKPYARGAEPLRPDHPGALQLESLQETLDRSQKIVAERLGALTVDEFKQPVPGAQGGDETVGGALAKLQFHEAYHAGQVGILRRLVGHTGAIK